MDRYANIIGFIAEQNMPDERCRVHAHIDDGSFCALTNAIDNQMVVTTQWIRVKHNINILRLVLSSARYALIHF